MTRTIETQVLVVGGGPVGLTLGMDLASRGVETLLVEMRHEGEPPSVKCNHIAARSMEIFRRLGVAGKLRQTGLPADYSNDISYRVSFTGKELSRIEIPCRKDRYTATGGPDTWWPTPEPPHRINQIYIEPVLFAHAAAMPNLSLLNRVQINDFTQDDDGVQATGRLLDTGETISIRARYMVGCDGSRSGVRKAIGAKLSGTAVVQRVQSTYIRAPSLLSLSNLKPAWATFSLNPQRSGNVYAIDGKEKWLVHNYLRPGEEDFEAIDRDWALRTILGVGPDFAYEILSKEDWIGRRLVADKFRDRRVFICGDAAHLWVPMAGYGMNAGIADAANLAWLLAAHLNGWAPASIVDAHEKERLPITEQVSHFAMNHALALSKQRGDVPDNIDDDDAEGQRARAALGKLAYDLNVQQYCCGGLNFGYFYDQSPIIAYDGEKPPAYGMADFTPSTVPGCRTPHVWLDDGRSLYDAMGPDYTLLRFDPSIDVTTFLAAADAIAVPVRLLDVTAEDAAGVYDKALVLSRPDQHVAWRGDTAPTDPLGLIQLICGMAIQHEAA
ncbi:FAD-dependent oxidoreductase [Mesorhizobium sp. BR1-1-3]|jgi:2-polyprenyl-6-methoxyphenol hydroxylase-like FAD-dependent oxidoreductase|uniref:FAD-dependent oxidoreductase n=1 Tax=unclassified Mesorhizobium TaxID=325217 RepID=UPI000FE99940|nr:MULTISPECIES: FAD-dependent oxidoreductase [unclassified Mesorhizobium]MBZ9887647.1 FAD-dependent oxidoreductase [Mesorhizobium sp. BR1-1-3]RWE29419.1 MAG: monooxygenase [Mesorhizobium sp.]TGP87979.1 monooxygenase [Mesorhizobium sp. M8A.F.Ca.ET.218.01.1.1]TGT15777.1 monooxygenase [Mesorhizobium sp. M8A.F.Ca.ET.213.01.1.1]